MVIDELLVVLGLDASQFNDEQRKALEAFRRTKLGAEDFGKSMETQGAKLTEIFGAVRKSAVGMIGAFLGNEVVQYVHRIAEMDASTGRFARTIGIAVEGLSRWQGMVRQVGGDPNSATGTLSALQQQIETVRQGGGMFEGGYATLMNRAGVTMRDNADATLRKIQGYLSGEVEAGRMRPEEQATWLRRVPGMSPDMLNLMMSGSQKFTETEDAVKKLGAASDKSAEAGTRLQQSLDRLGQALDDKARDLMTKSVPYATELLDATTADISKKKEFLKDWGATSWSDLWDAFKSGFSGWRSGGKVYTMDGVRDGAASGGGGPGGRMTRGDRNNNPGNIEYGAFAKAHGATGSDGRFAIFPDRASGESAMAELLAKNYQGLTLAEIQRKWVGNHDANYLGAMSAATGVGPGEVPNLRDPTVRANLMRGMSRGEGTYLGARGAAGARRDGAPQVSSSTNSSEVNIGTLNVNAPNATDADGIAGDIGGALKRSTTAAFNYGLI